MNIKEMTDVMLAYENGAEIECKKKDMTEWLDVICEPSWNWSHLDYRIKPKPATRPMTIEEIAQLDSWKVVRVGESMPDSIVGVGHNTVYVAIGEDIKGYSLIAFIENYLQYPSRKPFEVEI